MKAKIAVAALVVTAIAVYFIKRSRRTEEAEQPVKKSHHLTNVFAKAKAVSSEANG